MIEPAPEWGALVGHPCDPSAPATLARTTTEVGPAAVLLVPRVPRRVRFGESKLSNLGGRIP